MKNNGRRNERGFLLVETLIGLLFISMIAVAVTATVFQIYHQSIKNRDYTQASQFTMNVVHWISRDADMAQSVATQGSTGFPLTLNWVDWDNNSYRAVYSISGGKMNRAYTVNGGAATNTLLAQSVNTVSGNTTAVLNGKVLSVQITATIGGGTRTTSVSNQRDIFLRSLP